MRIGILGAGDMGRTHARVFAAIPEVTIAGMVGRSRERVEEVAREVGVPALTDPWAILDDESVEAIDITYPSALHREWAVAALERGKHVFCETPMALTLEDVDAMIAAAQASGKILMPAQVQRFGVEYAFVHDEVASGKLGRPLAAYAGTRLPPYGAGTKRPLELYGGPMLDLMIHPFDMLNWLLGPPVSLSGTGQSGPSGDIDYAFVALEYPEASGLVEGSAVMPASFPFTLNLRVLGEEGAIETSLALGPEEAISLVRYPPSGEPEALTLEGTDPYTAECQYFARCLRGDADPAAVNPGAEREALRVALAARQAIAERTVVSVTDFNRRHVGRARTG
ncbi:MAG TPA: Gfo/Idh/MocA family oxidoreductase [Chloroflexota bacterium]|nr:Gfo/Idh/MocA family oxidoreductase [Chloroflexota bacterium]